MQQTKPENYVNVGGLTIKKCAICELDKYQSSYQYIVNEVMRESKICRSCRLKLKQEMKQDKAILHRYSLL